MEEFVEECFQEKPLGLALIPSTQLYGTWEIGEVLVPHKHLKVGDVLLSINGNKKVLDYSNDELIGFLKQLPCPIWIMFKRPNKYRLNVDSHSVATAMFPTSKEYIHMDVDRAQKAWNTRASAQQWKTASTRHPLHDQMTKKMSHEESGTSMDTIDDMQGIVLSPSGFFDTVVDSPQIGVVFTPSTSIIGTMEVGSISSPHHDICVGDVIIAVNQNEGASRWSVQEFQEHFKNVTFPVHLRMCRPWMHAKYLRSHFRERSPSSESLSKAMFPNTNKFEQTKEAQAGYLNEATKRKSSSEWKEISASLDEIGRFTMYRDRANHISKCLTLESINFLTTNLPISLQLSQLKLFYSSELHGWNSITFYAHLRNKGPTLLVIEDSNQTIFGAFSSSSWEHKTGVYGNGNAFLFHLHPKKQAYRWSGKNYGFQMGMKECIAVGCGASEGSGDGTALFIDLDRACGQSQPSSTFLNPTLSQGFDNTFACVKMEVWGFQGVRV